VDDVWVFQVLKFDKTVGTVGLPLEVTARGSAVEPYGLYYLNLDGLISQDFHGGIVNLNIGGTRYYRNITWIETLPDGDGAFFSRIYLDATLPGASIGQTAYLLESQAIEWNPELLNGTRYILYEYNDDVLHPLTGELGAYFPVRPDAIDTDIGRLLFTGRTLPIPDPDSRTSNLGAYVVVAPGQVLLQANGRDPLTGQLVESNIIRLSLKLPSFMTGVDTSGALPIPTGWKFPSEESNIGGGLDGANFVTINPSASGVSQFVLQLEMSP
jgi:hypothetical protein